MFTDVLLILAATVIQQNVIFAQSHNDPYDTVYYWFTPARIVGVAVGVALFILILISLLIMAYRRRRKRARTVPNATAPTYSAEVVQPRPYPSWQQPQIPQYGQYADPRWYYSTPGTAPAPYSQAKPLRDTRGTAPPEDPASVSSGQRITPSDPLSIPVPTSQLQRPASTSRVESIVPPVQTQSSALGPVQSVAPFEGASSSSSPVWEQEQVTLPQPAYTKATQSVSGTNGREPSPPPYSPPTRPLEPSGAQATR